MVSKHNSGRRSGPLANDHEFLLMCVIVGTTLGVGQAIGNAFYTISATFYVDGNSAGADTGGYLFSRILGSIMFGLAWDVKSSRHDGKPASRRLGRRMVQPAILIMAASLVVMTFASPHRLVANSILKHVCFISVGLATGAMNVIAPIFAVESGGSEHFLQSYSWIMLAAVIGQTIAYNVFEYFDWVYNHSDDGYMVYADDIDDDAPSNWAAWGGCKANPSCYKISLYLQVGLLLVGSAAAFRLQRVSGDYLRQRSLESAALLASSATGPTTGDDLVVSL